jgi:hypothetical protein
MSVTLRGTVHGKTIELENESGLADGERVEVLLLPQRGTSKRRGILRSAGAWANLPDVEQVEEELRKMRREAKERDLPE